MFCSESFGQLVARQAGSLNRCLKDLHRDTLTATLQVRAHSVLKEQKQNAAGANASETSDVESESVIENMKRQIDYLEKQLQMERDATKTARDDCEVMAQKHQHVLLEQKKEWRNRSVEASRLSFLFYFAHFWHVQSRAVQRYLAIVS